MKTFNERVYDLLRTVPLGKVTTYKELALAVHTKAYRAVGNAMRCNKDPVAIPCYKVVCSDGFVGNYSGPGGMNKKIMLLKNDGIIVEKNMIRDLERYLYRFR